MIIVTIWWFVSARKWFKGPKVNIEHMMFGRGGNAIDGKIEERDSGYNGLAPVGSTDKPNVS